MSSIFCLTVRFLDPVPTFHGRGDGSEPEWPPSPLRLFQALVAASAARWPGSHFGDYAAPALKWLEAQDAHHYCARYSSQSHALSDVCTQ